MKYNLVEIRPEQRIDGKPPRKWVVAFSLDKIDRVRGKAAPSDLGFYYYPRRIGPHEAFNELKNHLIKTHKQRIKGLQKSLEALQALVYNGPKKDTK